jgi:hypothetical protein
LDRGNSIGLRFGAAPVIEGKMTKKIKETSRKGITVKSVFASLFMLTAAAAGGGCFPTSPPA